MQLNSILLQWLPNVIVFDLIVCINGDGSLFRDTNKSLPAKRCDNGSCRQSRQITAGVSMDGYQPGPIFLGGVFDVDFSPYKRFIKNLKTQAEKAEMDGSDKYASLYEHNTENHDSYAESYSSQPDTGSHSNRKPYPKPLRQPRPPPTLPPVRQIQHHYQHQQPQPQPEPNPHHQHMGYPVHLKYKSHYQQSSQGEDEDNNDASDDEEADSGDDDKTYNLDLPSELFGSIGDGSIRIGEKPSASNHQINHQVVNGVIKPGRFMEGLSFNTLSKGLMRRALKSVIYRAFPSVKKFKRVAERGCRGVQDMGINDSILMPLGLAVTLHPLLMPLMPFLLLTLGSIKAIESATCFVSVFF